MKEGTQFCDVIAPHVRQQRDGVQALVFDMDGTLVDSEKLHFDAWRGVLGEFGIHFDFKAFVAYIGVSNEKLAQNYIDSAGLGVGVTEMVRKKQKLYLDMIPGIEPLPGVMESIGAFAGRYRLAVASSSDCVELEKILATLGIRHFFEIVVGGDLVTQKKPHPEIYTKTAGLLGLKPDQCLAFEDSESGVAAAKSAEMLAIAIPNGLSRAHDFSKADRIVGRMDLVDETLISSFTAV